MKKQASKLLTLIVFVVLKSPLAMALDRRLVERLPKFSHNQEMTDYLFTVIYSRDKTPPELGANYFSIMEQIGRPAMAVESADITLSNWREGKCEEVHDQIKSARGLFRQFKAVARELAGILANEVEPETTSYVEVLYQRMEDLRKQILSSYPEVFDSWEITVNVKWEFPKDKIHIDKSLGPLFTLTGVATPHLQWQATDPDRKLPKTVAYKTSYPNVLKIWIKTVPAEFCSGPFRMQAFGSVSGNVMNSIPVQLITHKPVQLF